MNIPWDTEAWPEKSSYILQWGFQSAFSGRKANIAVRKVSFLVYFILLQAGSAFYPATELRASLLAVLNLCQGYYPSPSQASCLWHHRHNPPLQLLLLVVLKQCSRFKSRTGFQLSGWKNNLKRELHVSWVPCFPPTGCKGNWSQALSWLPTQHFLRVVLRMLTNNPPHSLSGNRMNSGCCTFYYFSYYR